jgi:predicted nucleic acid-binding protein
MIISLDTSPLSLVTQPKAHPDADACKQWLRGHLSRGTHVVVPEVVDFELRRELLRAGKTRSLARLDAFVAAEPDRLILLNRKAMLFAAELWAKARRQGLATADPKELDIDVLQAAQLLTAGIDPEQLAVATTNVGHLARFVKADLWSNL